MKNAVKTVLAIFAIIILLIIGTIFVFKIELTPKNYEDQTQFTIEQGMYGKAVFNKLEEEGIIRNSKICYAYTRYLSGITIDFKAGTFVLNKGMNLDELVETLCDDSQFYRETVTLTITEGEFLINIASNLGSIMDVSEDEIINYWTDADIIKSYSSDYEFITDEMFNSEVRYYLEGYLFPSTYEFYKNSSLDEITRKFLDQTERIYKKYKDDFASAPEFYHETTKETSKATIHDIFTIASVLQWESGNSTEEMQDVASVFYNRLNGTNYYKQREKLMSSVTSCYAQGYYKDTCLLVDSDLNIAYTGDDGELYSYSSYNTYTRDGIPVGPISNPGESAIYAALHPNNTDYLYFVGDVCGIDGATHFAVNNNDFEKISKKYVGCK